MTFDIPYVWHICCLFVCFKSLHTDIPTRPTYGVASPALWPLLCSTTRWHNLVGGAYLLCSVLLSQWIWLCVCIQVCIQSSVHTIGQLAKLDCTLAMNQWCCKWNFEIYPLFPRRCHIDPISLASLKIAHLPPVFDNLLWKPTHQ